MVTELEVALHQWFREFRSDAQRSSSDGDTGGHAGLWALGGPTRSEYWLTVRKRHGGLVCVEMRLPREQRDRLRRCCNLTVSSEAKRTTALPASPAGLASSRC